MKTITPETRRPAVVVSPSNPPPPNASIELRIDAVVFDGFSRSEAQRASAALQQELIRLITVDGLPTAPHGGGDPRREQLSCPSISALPTRPEWTGVQAARALHGGLRL